MTIEWVLSSLIAILAALIGTLFKMHLTNRDRLDRHDVVLAGLASTDKKIDSISERIDERFDKHEEKEDKVLGEMSKKIERLIINVALLKKSPNGDKENG